ncbi:MAG TPA: type II CAAX endopeptidase family protein [Longimicrobiales bacterium]|nr:type II CAAX endopeptidase family protein [Longimicrobiales bacterium]
MQWRSLSSAFRPLLRLLLFALLYFGLRIFVAPLRELGTLMAAVAAGVFLLKTLERRPIADMGIPLNKRVPRQFGAGLLLGTIGIAVGCLVLLLFGALRYADEGGTFGAWLGLTASALWYLLIPAAAEEALFRGYAFQKLVAAFGPWIAVVIASAGFAWAHRNNPSINAIALANIFVAGVVLSLAFLRTRSLWFATGVHLGWNWSMGALFDLPISGLELFNAPLYEPRDRGPAWLSGGAFGPEAGLAGLLALGFIAAGIVWVTRKREWLT